MPNSTHIFTKCLPVFFFLLTFSFGLLAQETEQIENKPEKNEKETTEKGADTTTASQEKQLFLTQQDALRPSKAAFYSAILPGLGQAYNKDYWKIPIVYAALGTGAFFSIRNGNEFNRFRTALRNRLAGEPDEFTIINDLGESVELISQQGLIDSQDFLREQRDLAIIITVGIYLLQILEANVDAHLSQFSITDDLTLQPDLYIDPMQQRNINYGVKLSYRLGQ